MQQFSDNPSMTFFSCFALASILQASDSPDQLRVMVWNVLRGGNSVEQGPEKALQVIREAGPDLSLIHI